MHANVLMIKLKHIKIGEKEMQEPLTVERENISVNGYWGSNSKITTKAPLVIWAEDEESKNTAEYADYLNEKGVLTFRYNIAGTFDEAINQLKAIFDTLRLSEEVAGEYIIFAGYGTAARVAAITAEQIGKSVKGLILLTPEFSPEDKIKMKNYTGATMIVNGTDDAENPLKDVDKVAKEMPNADLLEIRGGHHQYTKEDIERVKGLMQAFMYTALK